MKVLYLCHRIPYPPTKGEKIRAFRQIKAIAQQHEIDLFTFADDPTDLKYAAALQEFCRRVEVVSINRVASRIASLPALASNEPLSIAYFRSRRLRSLLDQAYRERQYDRLFVYCSAMAQYAKPGMPAVMDMVDVDSDKWRQYTAKTSFPYSLIYAREARQLQTYETEICRRFDHVVLSTDREAEILRSFAPDAPVDVIPNGVDTDFFEPALKPAGLPPTVIFVGDMTYFPNELAVTYFATEVLPKIHAVQPATEFLIVGRNPSPKVRQLESDRVSVTGFVPDVRPFLHRSDVCVAPFSIACGIQNKILEAMAAGLPVVSTSRAAQGLLPQAAALVQIADTAERMADEVMRLLSDKSFARCKGLHARSAVVEHYNWTKSLNQLLQLIEEPRPNPQHPRLGTLTATP